MAAILIEFMLSFLFITIQLNNIATNNNLATNVINKQINSNYSNVYQSFIYNIYQDSFDNDYFEEFLGIKGNDCLNDNNSDGDTTDPLDGCLVYFMPETNKLYKYKGQVSNPTDINKMAYLNKFIPNTFISVKKDTEYYEINTYYIYAGKKVLLGNFLIYKDK